MQEEQEEVQVHSEIPQMEEETTEASKVEFIYYVLDVQPFFVLLQRSICTLDAIRV